MLSLTSVTQNFFVVNTRADICVITGLFHRNIHLNIALFHHNFTPLLEVKSHIADNTDTNSFNLIPANIQRSESSDT